MNDRVTTRKHKSGRYIPCIFGCLLLVASSFHNLQAQESALPNDRLSVILDTSEDAGPITPFRIDGGNQNAGLDFDLAGSETRKLTLKLNQPLTLNAGTQARVLNSGANLLGLDATLALPVGENFSIHAGTSNQLGKAQFQTLGNIQCMNGTLRSDSYTASGCRFVDTPHSTNKSRMFRLGTQFSNDNASASINWFTQQSEFNQGGANRNNPAGAATILSDSMLNPGLGNPLFSPSLGDPLQQFNSEASGVDVNFKLGITTNNVGDIRLGLAFSRVLDAGYDGLYASSVNPLSWALAEPFNSARMDLEWSNGSFSSGIQGYYRESVDFLDRDNLDSLTTFDVHFTWRTPWNANLSVGASNVLNAGSLDTPDVQNQPVDPLESVYGRIPYVRYKQDL